MKIKHWNTFKSEGRYYSGKNNLTVHIIIPYPHAFNSIGCGRLVKMAALQKLVAVCKSRATL